MEFIKIKQNKKRPLNILVRKWAEIHNTCFIILSRIILDKRIVGMIKINLGTVSYHLMNFTILRHIVNPNNFTS